MKTPSSRRWQAAAARLGERIPRQKLHAAALSWADNRPQSERWAVALSGGADSVALLLLLWAHWPERRRRLVAFHFNHRLRGAASQSDERFCKALCAGLGVTLVSDRWAGARQTRSEAAARQARFAFIGVQMARRRMKSLWLGHQQDDIAESVLMRLARGSGTAGLAAPRPLHAFAADYRGGAAVVHVRPLLTLKKRDLSLALAAAGGLWREDASNAEDAHFRNRLRNGVIPRWAKASGRDALAGAALSRDLLDEDNQALEAWVDALKPIGTDGSLSLARLEGKPRAVVRRALHGWLLRQKNAGDFSRQAFETLLQSVEKGEPVRHSLGRHGFAAIRGRKLRFEGSRKLRSLH
jgi:tRNA(Ile)-lysidine synthase